MSGSVREAQTTDPVTRSSDAPVEQGLLAYAARQDPCSLLRCAAAERAAELAYEPELSLALDLEEQVRCAQASSFRAVREIPDRTEPAQMREDQLEAPRGMMCGP
jgi:hypothetical protein